MIEERNRLREATLAQGRSTDEIAPPVPTPETDAAPPGDDSTKIVVLAGAIKYWWLHKCPTCGKLWNESRSNCIHSGTRQDDMLSDATVPLWDSPDHQRYLKWRRDMRAALIERGYLTYAPHEAFKGRWDERAQAINDAAIAAADAMIVMSEPEWISEGTDAEVIHAGKVGTQVFEFPPPYDWQSEEFGRRFLKSCLDYLDKELRMA